MTDSKLQDLIATATGKLMRFIAYVNVEIETNKHKAALKLLFYEI